MKPTCRDALERLRLDRKIAAYAKNNPRITEKLCEWDGCPIIFPIASTGVIPPYCPQHKRTNVAPKARAATAAWRLKTIEAQCQYWNCQNLQHPSAQGWCHFHYPILSMHGLSSDHWWKIFDAQDGLCPICLQTLKDGRPIAVDHDHALAPTSRHDREHVRGLLHMAPCNSIVVGGIETAIANGWLERAMAFIKYPPSESN